MTMPALAERTSVSFTADDPAAFLDWAVLQFNAWWRDGYSDHELLRLLPVDYSAALIVYRSGSVLVQGRDAEQVVSRLRECAS